MGWFQKHLNWTTVIVTFCSNVVSYFLVKILLNTTHIPYWGPRFSSGTIDVLLPAGSFYFDAYLLLASIFLILSFSWVLRKKGRRWTYLLFFIAFLVFEIPYFLSYMIEVPGFLAILFWYLRSLAVLPFLVGWIMLLALRNKSALPADSLF
jgi:hypothetical protein